VIAQAQCVQRGCEEQALLCCFVQIPPRAKYKKQEQPWLILEPKGFDSDDGDNSIVSAFIVSALR